MNDYESAITAGHSASLDYCVKAGAGSGNRTRMACLEASPVTFLQTLLALRLARRFANQILPSDRKSDLIDGN